MEIFKYIAVVLVCSSSNVTPIIPISANCIHTSYIWHFISYIVKHLTGMFHAFLIFNMHAG